MPDPSALYPQPPAPPQPSSSLMSDPLRALSALGTLNQLYQSQARFGAQQAIGRAWLRNTNSDGSINRPGLVSDLQRDPAAALGGPEAVGTLLDQHGKMIQNATAQFNQYAGQNKFVMEGIASLADKPNLSMEDVRHFVTTLGPNTDIPSFITSGWMNGLPTDPKKLRDSIVSIKNMVAGGGAMSARTEGPPGPGGQPQSVPLSAANYAGAMPTGQPIGEEIPQKGAAQRAADLEGTVTTSPQYHADLDNLKMLSKTLDIGGPTVGFEKTLGQLASRFGLPSTITPDQLKSVEEFDKIASSVALRQGVAFGDTDAARHTAVAANPNSGMSRYGREGVVDMLQGNQDAVDTTRRLWMAAKAKGAPASAHNKFLDELARPIDADVTQFNALNDKEKKNYLAGLPAGQQADFNQRVQYETSRPVLDPRVFQFNRMTRENQQKFLQDIDPAELPDFEQKYRLAIGAGWVRPLKKQ